MAAAPQVGARVKWAYGDPTAHGEVIERHFGEVSRVIDGEEISLTGTEDNPALLISADSGGERFMLAGEVTSIASPAENTD